MGSDQSVPNTATIAPQFITEEDLDFHNLDNATTLPRLCRAMAQGHNRYERGVTYYNHIIHTFGEEIMMRHRKVEVPNVGHNNLNMYTSKEGLQELFGNEPILHCGDQTTATNEIASSTLQVYPNPAQSFFFLENNMDEEATSIIVYDIFGAERKRITLRNNTKSE